MRKLLAAAAGVVGIVGILYGISVKTKGAAAVSVIGRADGPTSIFLAGKIGNGFSTAAILAGAAVLILAAALFFWKKKG